MACASSPGFGASPEVACKPGSVPRPGCPDRGGNHSSRRRIAAPLEHSTRMPAPPVGLAAGQVTALDGPSSTACLFELAPGGACRAAGRPAVARGLLPHDFTLTCASPATASQQAAGSRAIGGVVSVALSLGSPRVAVNDLHALRSPDFPPADDRCPPAIPRPPPAAGNLSNRGARRSGIFRESDRESSLQSSMISIRY